MINNVLNIGDKIELIKTTFSDDGGTISKVYVSQLLDIVDSVTVNTAVPIESGHLVPLEVGGRFEMRFFTNNGMFTCKAEIEGRYKQDNLSFLKMKIMTDLKKDQRRQYYRLAKIMPMSYHLVSEEEARILEVLNRKTYRDDRGKRSIEQKLREVTPDNVNGTILNISGGGVKFVASVKHERGQILRMEFYLDENDASTFMIQQGRVVFASDIRNVNQQYESRVEFVDIDRLDRERIVKFVFNEERKIRKKEKGL